MNSLISWSLTVIVINYLLYSLTGYPVLWITLCYAAKPLGYYVAIVNLCMAVGIVGAGIWQGPVGAIKVALLLFGFNLFPSIVEALMGFGYRCG
jgi:hypothetical protein